VKEIAPLVAALIVTVVVLNFFPDLILYLPRLMR
jgi:TRAP-type C4-dicarboxylate transport system permease large subunit